MPHFYSSKLSFRFLLSPSREKETSQLPQAVFMKIYSPQQKWEGNYDNHEKLLSRSKT